MKRYFKINVGAQHAVPIMPGLKTSGFFILALALVAVAPGPLHALPQGPANGSPDSLQAGDSTKILAAADSSMVLDKKLSAVDYMENRERFFYPHTRRSDPFDFPLAEVKQDLGPALADLELTGVLFSPDGRSLAILSIVDKEDTKGSAQEGGKQTQGGKSFLVRVGDMVGRAEVIMIEADLIRFRIREYGIVRSIVKELKPFVEEYDGEPSEQPGPGGGPARSEDREYDGS
ncbi:MAG: hypothetical protein U9P14_09905 [Gemmatimonadota bacterium]|nr:hypothetical protein [Gemmatimonadota bacterium]